MASKTVMDPCDVPYPPSPELKCIKGQYHLGQHLATCGKGSSRVEFTWPKK